MVNKVVMGKRRIGSVVININGYRTPDKPVLQGLSCPFLIRAVQKITVSGKSTSEGSGPNLSLPGR